ncbi:unnamed protein product [Pleuronectes platessa]|uniref:Uncharacterized protein n=1 Tax=Pleuronectes platessa TaxID=8262 RepID=A0A9N7VGK3_PLEPL|nr:unnamed protein product [Pleuronectes platessa]
MTCKAGTPEQKQRGHTWSRTKLRLDDSCFECNLRLTSGQFGDLLARIGSSRTGAAGSTYRSAPWERQGTAVNVNSRPIVTRPPSLGLIRTDPCPAPTSERDQEGHRELSRDEGSETPGQDGYTPSTNVHWAVSWEKEHGNLHTHLFFTFLSGAHSEGKHEIVKEHLTYNEPYTHVFMGVHVVVPVALLHAGTCAVTKGTQHNSRSSDQFQPVQTSAAAAEITAGPSRASRRPAQAGVILR